MTSVEVLQDARKLLTAYNGWMQNMMLCEWAPRHYSYCSLGALRAASGLGYEVPFKDISGASEVQTVTRDAMELIIEANGLEMGIITWNDEPGRTQDEILAGFEKAIALGLKKHA